MKNNDNIFNPPTIHESFTTDIADHTSDNIVWNDVPETKSITTVITVRVR